MCPHCATLRTCLELEGHGVGGGDAVLQLHFDADTRRHRFPAPPQGCDLVAAARGAAEVHVGQSGAAVAQVPPAPRPPPVYSMTGWQVSTHSMTGWLVSMTGWLASTQRNRAGGTGSCDCSSGLR